MAGRCCLGCYSEKSENTPSELEYFTEVEEVKKIVKKVVTGVLAVELYLIREYESHHQFYPVASDRFIVFEGIS